MLNHTMNCTKCEGIGDVHSEYANFDPITKEFTAGTKACHYCAGRGTFPALDVAAVLAAILTTRGTKKFRKSMTSPVGRNNVEAARAYYVWRLARFHGGADVTMPMMAMMLIEGDPVQRELDKLADEVAKRVYGTDLAAAASWGPVLFGDKA